MCASLRRTRLRRGQLKAQRLDADSLCYAFRECVGVRAPRHRQNAHPASIYELPFPESSFDAADAQSVLFHLREPLQPLKEILRVLKPGGVAGIVDGDLGCQFVAPAAPAIDKLLALLAHGLQHHGGDPYYARNLRPLLHEAGFERVEGSATMLYFGSGDSAGRSTAEALRATLPGDNREHRDRAGLGYTRGDTSHLRRIAGVGGSARHVLRLGRMFRLGSGVSQRRLGSFQLW
jgi:SAM-dependent methyltransferase